MSYKVFISSTQKDLDLARDLSRRLNEAGVEVFSVEKSVAPGEIIMTRIEQGLRESDEVIVILTNNSIDSPWVMSELGAAFSLHKRVTPVVLGVEPSEIPPMVRHLMSVKYSDLEDYIAELAERTRGVATAHPTTPS